MHSMYLSATKSSGWDAAEHYQNDHLIRNHEAKDDWKQLIIATEIMNLIRNYKPRDLIMGRS